MDGLEGEEVRRRALTWAPEGRWYHWSLGGARAGPAVGSGRQAGPREPGHFEVPTRTVDGQGDR